MPGVILPDTTLGDFIIAGGTSPTEYAQFLDSRGYPKYLCNLAAKHLIFPIACYEGYVKDIGVYGRDYLALLLPKALAKKIIEYFADGVVRTGINRDNDEHQSYVCTVVSCENELEMLERERVNPEKIKERRIATIECNQVPTYIAKKIYPLEIVKMPNAEYIAAESVALHIHCVNPGKYGGIAWLVECAMLLCK